MQELHEESDALVQLMLVQLATGVQVSQAVPEGFRYVPVTQLVHT